jgi:hypothetical protein
MDVRMPLGTIAECLDGQGDDGNPQLFAKSDPKIARETRCCTLTQLAKQFAILEKIPANALTFPIAFGTFLGIQVVGGFPLQQPVAVVNKATCATWR